jgi:hypothetical protein
MTNREKHDPNPDSNEALYHFMERWLQPAKL